MPTVRAIEMFVRSAHVDEEEVEELAAVLEQCGATSSSARSSPSEQSLERGRNLAKDGRTHR